MAIAFGLSEGAFGFYDTVSGLPVFQNETNGEWRTYGNESNGGMLVDPNAVATPALETSAGGDYRRQARSMWGDPDPNYFGGAGHIK